MCLYHQCRGARPNHIPHTQSGRRPFAKKKASKTLCMASCSAAACARPSTFHLPKIPTSSPLTPQRYSRSSQRTNEPSLSCCIAPFHSQPAGSGPICECQSFESVLRETPRAAGLGTSCSPFKVRVKLRCEALTLDEKCLQTTAPRDPRSVPRSGFWLIQLGLSGQLISYAYKRQILVMSSGRHSILHSPCCCRFLASSLPSSK